MAENASERKIIDLNTDCLIKIFKYVNNVDLLHLLEAHEKFTDAVNYIAQNELCEFAFTQREFKDDCLLKLQYLEKFLQLFGNHLKGICISLPFTQEVLSFRFNPPEMNWCENCESYIEFKNNTVTKVRSLIEQYCSENEQLEYFAVYTVAFGKEFFENNARLFKNVQILHLREALFFDERFDLSWIFNVMPNLKHLVIIECSRNILMNKTIVPFDVIRKVAESQLKELTFLPGEELKFDHDDTTIPINTTLMKLNIGRCNGRDLSFFAKHFPHLQAVRYNEENSQFRPSIAPLVPILELQNLKHFSFIFDSKNLKEIELFVHQAALLNTLETLHLQSKFETTEFAVNDTEMKRIESSIFDGILRMTNLRKLGLELSFSSYDKPDLDEINQNLTNLRELSLHCRTQQCLDSILNFVKNNNKLTKLIIIKSDALKVGNIDFYNAIADIREMQDRKETFMVEIVRVTIYWMGLHYSFQIPGKNVLMKISDR